MKKSLIALAALAATASFAQSSVTISGALDAGLQSQKLANNVTQNTMGTGIHGASRLRFVGVEDLGGGNKANFWLEMQPSFQTGAVNAELFNRGAWLGLSGGWGELRLGRQGTNSVAAVCDIDQMGCYSGFSAGGILFSGQGAPGALGSALMSANPNRGETQAASTSAATGTVDSTRYMRAVRYSLPTIVSGLGINVTHAYGQVATATAGAAGNSQGIDANYTTGNLKLTAAYQKAGADQGSDKTGNMTTVGGIYNFGFMSLGAGMQTEKADGTGITYSKAEGFALTALFPMGAATPYVKYGQRKYSGGSLTESVTAAKVTNMGVRYALSKRTYLYGDYVQNSVSDDKFMAATSLKNQKSVGLVHNF